MNIETIIIVSLLLFAGFSTGVVVSRYCIGLGMKIANKAKKGLLLGDSEALHITQEHTWEEPEESEAQSMEIMSFGFRSRSREGSK